jgi:cell division protease FtsH
MKKKIIFVAFIVVCMIFTTWMTTSIKNAQNPSELDLALQARTSAEEVSFTEMKSMALSSGPEDQITIFRDMAIFNGTTPGVRGTYRASLNYRTDDDIWTSDQIGATVKYQSVPLPTPWSSVFSSIVTLLLVGMVALILFRTSMQAGSGNPSYKLLNTKDIKETLDDVAGLSVARAEIRELIDLIRSSGKIGKIGANPPKGVLLKGPPGTGKTLLARALAKEAGVSFMMLNASRLHETFIGVGPRRVERAFQMAAKNAPCIIFIDEIDAIGTRENSGGARSDQERANLINTFLTNMDGIVPGKDVFVVAATNRPDMVDPAILRPGRIDRHLTVGLPNKSDRKQILAMHAKNLPLDPGVDFDSLAGSTPGMSGADLAALCNEAGIYAGREGSTVVTKAHFAAARKKIMMGETGTMTILTEQEKEVTAWHEAGHAVVASVLRHADPIEHATILPTGGSLGHVLQVPSHDRNMMTKAQLMDRLTILAAGRAAEEHKFGHQNVTNGAAGDITAMTDLATAMITKWGMGDKGMLQAKAGINGKYSDEIEAEIRRLCNKSLDLSRKLLEENKNALKAVATALIEKDTLSGTEIAQIVAQHCVQDDNQGKEAA